MGLYQKELPKVFPYMLTVQPESVRRITNLLMDFERDDVPNGSSFAVTVDPWGGNWNLWLSRVSYQYLKSQGRVLDKDQER